MFPDTIHTSLDNLSFLCSTNWPWKSWASSQKPVRWPHTFCIREWVLWPGKVCLSECSPSSQSLTLKIHTLRFQLGTNACPCGSEGLAWPHHQVQGSHVLTSTAFLYLMQLWLIRMAHTVLSPPPPAPLLLSSSICKVIDNHPSFPPLLKVKTGESSGPI